jgi:hypothetical protein
LNSAKFLGADEIDRALESRLARSKPISLTLAALARRAGLPQSWGCLRQEGIVAPIVGGESGCVAWILRLVEIGPEGEGQA